MFSAVKGSLSLLTGRQRFAVSLLAVATLFINSLDIVAIALLSFVGALAVGEVSVIESFPWLQELAQNTLVILMLVAAAVIFSIKTVSGLFLVRVRQNFLASLEIYFSRIIATSVFSGDLSSVKKHSRAHLEWTILRSTHLAFGSIIGQFLSLFTEATLTLFILILFFYTDWLSALLVLIYFAAVILIFQLVTQRKVTETGSDYAGGSVSVGQAISDTLAAFKEISVHSRVPYFLERLSEARARTAKASALQNYLQAIPRLVVELALIVGALGFAAFQYSVSAGNVDLAVISIFIVGSLRMMSSLLPLYRSFMQLRYDRPQALSSQHLVREAQQLQAAGSKRQSAWINPRASETQTNPKPIEVELKSVTFQYRDRVEPETVVDGVSLSIEPGTTVAFIGPSGAGKSTLVDLILGLHTPTAGQLLCSGEKPKDLRQLVPGLMSYVPQRPGLISGTLRENIALGVPPEDVDEVAMWDAIRISQIEKFISDLPHGIYTRLGEQADSLSGGQIQRIGVARALYTRPRLLVLDEATSALDAETEASITDSLSMLHGQVTTIVVAHRLSTVQHADRVFVIDSGKLVASGKLRDLEKEVPLVKKYIALMSFD